MLEYNGENHYTIGETAKLLGIPRATAYSRRNFDTAMTKWGIIVLRDPSDGKYKYYIKESAIDNVWRKQKARPKLTDKQKAFLKK